MPASRSALRTHATLTVGALVAALAGGILLGWGGYEVFDHARGWLNGRQVIAAAVARIIEVESNGCPSRKNPRSTATGAGQFIDETWLRLIRAHRPELAKRSDVLELRRDPALAREIATRFAERNAAKLRRHGLSVTPATLYLSHFAGSAGAVALLLAHNTADAAMIMAAADVTGQTTREKIVTANPFLQRYTVGDLKRWAERRMTAQRVARRAACKEPAAG